MELDILIAPNRMLVQDLPSILCVVFDKGQFFRTIESKKWNFNFHQKGISHFNDIINIRILSGGSVALTDF